MPYEPASAVSTGCAAQMASGMMSALLQERIAYSNCRCGCEAPHPGWHVSPPAPQALGIPYQGIAVPGKLASKKTDALLRQRNRCGHCRCQMRKASLNLPTSESAEHLRAQSMGGRHGRDNSVAKAALFRTYRAHTALQL